MSHGHSELPKFYVAAVLGDEKAKEIVRRRSRGAPNWPIPPELDGWVSPLQAWMAMRNRIRQIRDESHGFAPSPVIPGQFDLHVAIMCHGLDAMSALKRFAGASRLLRPDIAIECHLTRRRLELSVRMKGKADPVRAIYEEIYAVAIHCSLRWVTGEQFEASWVRAPSPPATVTTTIVSALGCPIVRGGRGVTLVYPSEAARVRVMPVKLGRWGSVVVDQFVRELKQRRDAASGAASITPTIDCVRTLLSKGRQSEANLARRLNISAATQVRDYTSGGVDYAFEMAGSIAALDLAWAITQRGGQTVSAGLPHSDQRISLPPLQLVSEERTLKGSYMGSCVPLRDIPVYIALYRAGRLPVDRILSHHVRLADLNGAFDRLAAGETVRQVLDLG